MAIPDMIMAILDWLLILLNRLGWLTILIALLLITKPCDVSHGQVIAAMLRNSLGFHSHALYLVPEYFADKPIDLLIAPGIYSEHLNHDVLGRTFYAVFDYGVSSSTMNLRLKRLTL
ncbi:DUF4277 domain-containing protein [Thorsellia kenyensis]|uniref:DUF4277 domain-containing protein n=1 Tax=Thorsellia kenyensis TaxID=1549888 RepID=A0ABV6CC74_9GAMM